MTTKWEDLAARARGLATHLIPRASLESLAGAADLPALAERWAELGLLPADHGGADPASLELAARREAARRLRVLGRWLGDRAAVLAVFFEDEDRRSVRAMVRGAEAGISREARLSGLIPTPELSERLLEELAGQDSPRRIAALLVAWRHPFGTALHEVASVTHPDLARVELALHRAFAAQATRGAKSGGRALQDYVAETMDVLNAEAALMLAGGSQEILPEDAYLNGSRILTRDTFRQAAASAGVHDAWRVLGASFRGTPLEDGFRGAEPPPSLEAEILGARITAWRRKARLMPVGPAPVIEYLLRLRAQVLQLRSLLWATALGMPPAARARQLVGT